MLSVYLRRKPKRRLYLGFPTGATACNRMICSGFRCPVDARLTRARGKLRLSCRRWIARRRGGSMPPQPSNPGFSAARCTGGRWRWVHRRRMPRSSSATRARPSNNVWLYRVCAGAAGGCSGNHCSPGQKRSGQIGGSIARFSIRDGSSSAASLNTGGKGGTRTFDPGIMRPRDGYSRDAAPVTYVEYHVERFTHYDPQP